MTQRPGRGTGSDARDRGAAAVEFALLLPLLLLMVFGMIDFGLALHAKVTITQAAREGARLAALGQVSTVVKARTQGAATGLTVPAAAITVTTCAPTAPVTADGSVTITYAFTFLTPIGPIAGLVGNSAFGTGLTLTARGVMPCET